MRKGSLLLLNGQGPIAFHRKAVLDCVTNHDISRVGRIGVDVCTAQCLRVLSNTCFPSKVHESSRPAEREHSQCLVSSLCFAIHSWRITPRILKSLSGGFGLALQSEHSAGHLQIAIALVGYFDRERHTMNLSIAHHTSIILSLISQVLSSILYRCAAKADWRFCGGERWPFQSAHACLSLSRLQSKLPAQHNLIQRSGMLHHTYFIMFITMLFVSWHFVASYYVIACHRPERLHCFRMGFW